MPRSSSRVIRPLTEPPVDPVPWGILPVEQYLIRSWNYQAEVSADEQRRQIVRAFVGEDLIDPDVYKAVNSKDPMTRVPTQSEIDHIIGPLRSQTLRLVARSYSSNQCPTANPVFLRTHYAGGESDETKMFTWLADEVIGGEAVIAPKDRWWKLFNDSTIFDFGDDWHLFHDIMPEAITGRMDRTLRPSASLKDQLRKELNREPTTQEVADEIQYDLARGGALLLVLFDKEFFESDEAGLVFRDCKGNQIRSSRVDADTLAFLLIAIEIRGSLYQQDEWKDGVVGDKYKLDGEIGSVLYNS
ncbi:hypothetical protein HJFPF1_13027 [Paramyrothecium foliicola]|nr:hypothetical protein HJFPF1_13027 [Paramyrothecium foliicola]